MRRHHIVDADRLAITLTVTTTVRDQGARAVIPIRIIAAGVVMTIRIFAQHRSHLRIIMDHTDESIFKPQDQGERDAA